MAEVNDSRLVLYSSASGTMKIGTTPVLATVMRNWTVSPIRPGGPMGETICLETAISGAALVCGTLFVEGGTGTRLVVVGAEIT